MSDEIIWRLAIVRNNSTCPVCGKKITEHKACMVRIKSPNQAKTIPYTCDVLYCATCDLPFADISICKAVREATGCWLETFSPNSKKKSSVKGIRQKMTATYSKQPALAKTAKKWNSGFELVPNTTVTWKVVQNICGLKEKTNSCPKCQSRLRSDYTLLPVSEQKKAKIPGHLCSNCRILYIEDISELTKIMRDNPLSKGFTLDGRELWNASIMEKDERQKEARRKREEKRKAEAAVLYAERKRRLQDVHGGIIMVCIKIRDQVQEFIITNTVFVANSTNIFHYRSPEGRELLSAAFADNRSKRGVLSGDSFQVKAIVFAANNVRELCHRMMPIELTIKADGGFTSSVMNQNYEVVDLLLYSPLTKRYEIIRGTYDKISDYCYSDIALFRNYVQKYGNPRVLLDFSATSRKLGNYNDLRSESVLMGYGYSVSEANQLSDCERQKILAEIVDLEILTVHQIVNLLEFNCRLHCSDRFYLARSKWMSDKDFIESYKVNPSRFLIAQLNDKRSTKDF